MSGKGMVGPNKKPKKGMGAQKEEQDELNKLSAAELQAQLNLYKDKVQDIKSKRNYIQMDRDMVEQFFNNTIQETEEMKLRIINKETEMEQLEESHRIQIKSYLQKVKHLEYEQEKTNKDIDQDGEEAQTKENEYFQKRNEDLKKEKTHLKNLYSENENANILTIAKEERNDQKTLSKAKEIFDKKIHTIQEKYETRLSKLKEELELKLKVEIHELEERKNLHINELMNNHERAFTELKKYYNSITQENLNLIKDQKAEIAKITANLAQNTKLIADMKAENKALKTPLEKKREERDALLNLLKQFSKHKMSYSNLKSKEINLNEKIDILTKDSEDLNIRYERVLKEKTELEEKFEKITQEVKKHAELQNMVLNQKLQSMYELYEAKEIQLKTVLDQANLDPQLYQQLTSKIKESMESKNSLIRNLKYSIHHATKAYNDAIRVYEAKLVEFGIPPEELGFEPLETITSSMPAGLVSS